MPNFYGMRGSERRLHREKIFHTWTGVQGSAVKVLLRSCRVIEIDGYLRRHRDSNLARYRCYGKPNCYLATRSHVSLKSAPRQGIEPWSPAWQAGILTTILSRIEHVCPDCNPIPYPEKNDIDSPRLELVRKITGCTGPESRSVLGVFIDSYRSGRSQTWEKSLDTHQIGLLHGNL